MVINLEGNLNLEVFMLSWKQRRIRINRRVHSNPAVPSIPHGTEISLCASPSAFFIVRFYIPGTRNLNISEENLLCSYGSYQLWAHKQELSNNKDILLTQGL